MLEKKSRGPAILAYVQEAYFIGDERDNGA